MNGEPLNDTIRQYEAAMRPITDWKFYNDWPQRVLNNLGRRDINTDDLAMQAQLYWVVTYLLEEIEWLRTAMRQAHKLTDGLLQIEPDPSASAVDLFKGISHELMAIRSLNRIDRIR